MGFFSQVVDLPLVFHDGDINYLRIELKVNAYIRHISNFILWFQASKIFNPGSVTKMLTNVDYAEENVSSQLCINGGEEVSLLKYPVCCHNSAYSSLSQLAS